MAARPTARLRRLLLTRHGIPRWLALRLANKPAQLNEALACSGAPWILVTDADARVPPDTLRQLLEQVESDPGVGVVGTTVEPLDPHPLDAWHWRMSNWIRRKERHAPLIPLMCGVAAPVLAKREAVPCNPC